MATDPDLDRRTRIASIVGLGVGSGFASAIGFSLWKSGSDPDWVTRAASNPDLAIFGLMLMGLGMLGVLAAVVIAVVRATER